VLLALVLLAGSALLATSRLLSDRSALERGAAAALLFPALTIGLVEALSPLGLIGQIPFLIGAGVLLLGALAIAGDEGREVLEYDLIALRETLALIARRPTRLFALLTGVAATLLAIFAAWVLPPWSWDGLGYHLPFAFDAISEGTMRPIASSAPYVNTYPHLGDVLERSSSSRSSASRRCSCSRSRSGRDAPRSRPRAVSRSRCSCSRSRPSRWSSRRTTST
jgi:hypothetical protein